MSAEHVACFVDKIAGRELSAEACFNKVGIGAALDKADILAVMLVRIDEAVLFGDFAHLRLVQAAQREHGVRQLLLRERVEHVALVLQGVDRLTQQITAFGFIIADLRIVAGNNIVAAKLLRTHEELVKFQVAVAVDAGVWRSAVDVGIDKTVDNVVLEAFSKVENVIGHAEAGRYATCVGYVVDRAAAVGLRNADILVGKKLHGYACAFVALLEHHQCGNAGINAAAHGDYCFLVHNISPSGLF